MLAEYTADDKILDRISQIEENLSHNNKKKDYKSPASLIHNPECIDFFHKSIIKGPFNQVFPKILEQFLEETRKG